MGWRFFSGECMLDRKLEIFIATVEEGNFLKAGERLNISATAVMKQMNILEEKLRVKLLDRSKKGTMPTERGKVFYQYAKKIIELCDRAIVNVQDEQWTVRYNLNVGNSFLFPAIILYPIWLKYRKELKSFCFHVESVSDDVEELSLLIKTLGERIDFFVAPCDSFVLNQKVKFLELGRCDIVCGMSQKHPLIEKEILSIQDFRGYPVKMWCDSDSQSLKNAKQYLYTQGITPADITNDMATGSDILDELEDEKLLIITPDYMLEKYSFLRRIKIDWEFRIPYGIIYANKPDEKMRLFIETVSQIVRRTENIVNHRALT